MEMRYGSLDHFMEINPDRVKEIFWRLVIYGKLIFDRIHDRMERIHTKLPQNDQSV